MRVARIAAPQLGKLLAKNVVRMAVVAAVPGVGQVAEVVLIADTLYSGGVIIIAAIKEENEEQSGDKENLDAGATAPAPEQAETEDATEDATKPLPKPPTGRGSVPPDKRDPKRVWTKAENTKKLEEQGGNCASCGKKTEMKDAAGHHVKRHADGGKTDTANQAVLCNPCHHEIHGTK